MGRAGAGRDEALGRGQMAYGIGSHQMYASGDRVDAQVGYGLPGGCHLVGPPRASFSRNSTVANTGSATVSGCWSRGT